MRLLVSWLRDFVYVQAPAEEIADRLGLRGFEVAAIEPLGDGDGVIDFEVTANRPDCLSVLGLAREVATLYDRQLTPPSSAPGAKVALRSSPRHRSSSRAARGRGRCPRYVAAVASRVRDRATMADLALQVPASAQSAPSSTLRITCCWS
jgi:phenylalanyl-tRNA synthetase beta chain